MSPSSSKHALPNGFELMWYQITDILGQGGFAYTYLAFDKNLNQHVAVKEFMPTEFVFRDVDNTTVRPQSKDKQELYEWGLERFRIEAQTLAQFKHPNIVRVLSVFEQNNTAYMVMEYERGDAFDTLLKQKNTIEEVRLKGIVLPILDGLQRIHDVGFIHRDIKPGNIYIRSDDTPVLLDFGSARNITNSSTRSMTSLVTPGFAPFEQYSIERTNQGPWTDIYAFSATLYLAITGESPCDAMQRANDIMAGRPDPYIAAVKHPNTQNYSHSFLQAVDAGLNFKASDRPQNAKDWAAMLAGTLPSSALISESQATPASDEDKTRIHPRSRRNTKGNQNPTRVNITGDVSSIASSDIVERPPKWLTTFSPKIPKTAYIFAAMLLILALCFAGYYAFIGSAKEPIRTDIVNDEHSQKLREDAKKAVKKTTGAITIGEILLNEQREARIASLMKQAKRIKSEKNVDREQQWRNSYRLYQEVLTLEPNHLSAKNNISLLYRDIENSVLDNITRRKFSDAKKHLAVLSDINAPTRKLDRLSKKISAAEQKQEQLTAAKSRQISQAKIPRPTAIPPKPTPLNPDLARSDMQGAVNAISIFKSAIEQRDRNTLDSIAVLSKQQEVFIRGLFDQYQIIRTRVSGVEFVKSRNEAQAILTIRKLVTSQGDVFKLSGGQETIKITAKFSKDTGWKIYL